LLNPTKLNYVDLNTLKTVYYSLIYSHLQYCISTWGMASRNALNPLEKLQKQIVRIITTHSYTAHTNPLFQKLNFLKLKDICTLEIAKKMYSYQINPDILLTPSLKLFKFTTTILGLQHVYGTKTAFGVQREAFSIKAQKFYSMQLIWGGALALH